MFLAASSVLVWRCRKEFTSCGLAFSITDHSFWEMDLSTLKDTSPSIFSVRSLWKTRCSTKNFFSVQSMSIHIDRKAVLLSKWYWIYLSNFQIFMYLSENLNRYVLSENISLELDWISINFSQLCVLVGLLEVLYSVMNYQISFPYMKMNLSGDVSFLSSIWLLDHSPGKICHSIVLHRFQTINSAYSLDCWKSTIWLFQFFISFWIIIYLSQKWNRIWEEMHLCFRPLDYLTSHKVDTHPRDDTPYHRNDVETTSFSSSKLVFLYVIKFSWYWNPRWTDYFIVVDMKCQINTLVFGTSNKNRDVITVVSCRRAFLKDPIVWDLHIMGVQSCPFKLIFNLLLLSPRLPERSDTSSRYCFERFPSSTGITSLSLLRTHYWTWIFLSAHVFMYFLSQTLNPISESSSGQRKRPYSMISGFLEIEKCRSRFRYRKLFPYLSFLNFFPRWILFTPITRKKVRDKNINS